MPACKDPIKEIERRKKLSFASKENAKNNPNYGMKNKHHSEFTKLIQKERKVGVKHSREHNIKIGKSLSKKRGFETSMFGKENKWGHHTDNTKQILRDKRMKQIFPIKDTSIEVKIQNYLKQLQIEFLTHQYINIEHGYQCDILIPSMNLVIECFGIYWHNYPFGNERDIQRSIELKNSGYKILIFWENEIRVMKLNDLKNKIMENKNVILD